MFLLLGLLATVAAHPSCPKALTDVISGSLLVNGSLLAEDGAIYPAEDFRPATDTYLTCVCKHRPCITKCCPHQHVYRRGPEGRAVCTSSPEQTAFYDRYSRQFHVLVGSKCGQMYQLDSDESFTVLANGTLQVEFAGEVIDFPVDIYCMEVVDKGNSTIVQPLVCFPNQ